MQEAQNSIANMQGKKRKHVPDPCDEMQLTSPLAIMLLNKFCWGRISACEVQEYAAAAVMGGAGGQDLHTLAKLGATGTWSGLSLVACLRHSQCRWLLRSKSRMLRG